MSLTAASLTAVVIGLDSATGIQTARELAALGMPVDGVADDPSHPCARTRVCRRVARAETGTPELLEPLERLARESPESRRVLVPCTDRSVLVLSRARDELASSDVLVLADPEVLERLSDKARFVDLARERGIPIAPSRALRSRADAERAADELAFPCAVKPGRKNATWRRETKAKLFVAERPEELLLLYDRCASWTHPLVAQSWIPGPDSCHYTCNAYFGRGGELLAAYESRKLRQWPRVGGQGCFSEGRSDGELRRITEDLFGSLEYRGLAYIETKRDPRTGEHRILETNVGRPTGRSAAARAAGVPLLEMMLRDAADLELPPDRIEGRDGVKWIYLRRDVQAAVSLARRGELGPVEWLRSLRGPRVYALFSWRDPVPFWMDLARAAGKAARAVVGSDPPTGDRSVPEMRRRRGREAVPLFDDVPDLAALRRGDLPIHASAFVYAGQGVIVAGPAHSGKTGALLAFGTQGARFLADDRVFLRRGGHRMTGLRRPLTVRPWHLRQLPELRRRAPLGRRIAVRALGALQPGDGPVGGPSDPGESARWIRRARAALHRRLAVEMTPEEVFGPEGCVEEARPGTIFLLESHRSADVTVERAGRDRAIERLTALAEAEWRDLLEDEVALRSVRSAYPETGRAGVDDLVAETKKGLEEALENTAAYVVRLPNPCSLRELYGELQGPLGSGERAWEEGASGLVPMPAGRDSVPGSGP